MGRESIFKAVIPASDFSVNTDFGVPVLASYRYENDNPLIAEETYIVSWDGQEYECVAQDGSAVMSGLILIGNGTPVMLAGNNEPFIIGQTAQIPLNFFALKDTQPTQHSVEIYQLVEDEQPETPDEPETPDTPEDEDTDGIVLHNRLNQPVVYGSYNKLLINRASGDKTIFSMGDAENVSFPADFSKGDMVLVPEKDKLFSKVSVIKPAELAPENIMKGKVIAGIAGIAEGTADPVLNLESITLRFEFDEGFQKYIYLGNGITYIVPDASYDVTFGSQDYSVKAVWMENLGENGAAVLGNIGMFDGEDTGEPFLILVNDEKQMLIIDKDGGEEYKNVSIKLNTAGDGDILETEEVELSFELSEAWGEMFVNFNPGISRLIPGVTYRIEWDGQQYLLKATDIAGDGSVVFIGNALMDAPSSEPFAVLYMAGMTAVGAIFDTAPNTHTFSIQIYHPGMPAVYTAEETTLQFVPMSDTVQTSANSLKINAVAPVEYSVIWDGTEYKCQGSVSGDGEGGVISGGGCPAQIEVRQGYMEIQTEDMSSSQHTISVQFATGGETIDPLMVEEVYSQIAKIQANKFYSDNIIKKAVLPNATSVGASAFSRCANLEYVSIPKATSIGNNCFQHSGTLRVVDMTDVTSIGQRAIGNSNTSLKTVILRVSKVPSLAAYNFTDTTVWSGSSATGWCYVPRSLLSTFQSANTVNWYSIKARYRVLEDYTIDGTIYGELDETKI